MFDPSTLAFTVKNPLSWYVSAFDGKKYYNDLLRIWHVDPCTDGSDNSCDWHGHKRKLNKQEKALLSAIYNMETILDNRPFYPLHEAHLRFKDVHAAKWEWLKRSGLRLHPRWHVWHWRITIVPLQNFKRWAFTRCTKCGGRFKYGESGVGTWDGDGPMWFKSEYLSHMSCDGVSELLCDGRR